MSLLFLLPAQAESIPPRPWDTLVRIDPLHPHHFVRTDGTPFFLFNKTAWHYFSAANPGITLDRANRLGASVIRVHLEGNTYFPDLGFDAWPWGGTREHPDFSTFNAAYWERVDERIELAATRGIGLNLTLFMSLKLPDEPASFELMRPYLERVIARLARHPNIFCWEVHNEYVRNPGFQRAVGEFLQRHDPHHRPVISSNGTTDYPLWPDAPWMSMALVHHCTGNQPPYDLRDWYLAIARNLRSFGKPAFNNETGRERRHKNDDPVHRRKQLWLAAAAGGYTTWHSWDGCEGIEDSAYAAPGQEFVGPFVRWWSGQQFWRVNPDFTAAQLAPSDPARDELVAVTLAAPARELLLAYVFTRTGGTRVNNGRLHLRLPGGDYRVEFFDPASGAAIGATVTHVSHGLHRPGPLALPPFADDLALRITRTETRDQAAIPDTH